MQNIFEQKDELERFMREVAQEGINAATSAQAIFIAVLLKTLVAKGVLEENDIAGILTNLNFMAASMSERTPATASALSSITLDLVHTFDMIESKRAN